MPVEFWLMTPREVYAVGLGVSRMRHAAERRLAWQTANLHRSKRMPSFDAYTGDAKTKATQSTEEIDETRKDYEADRDRMSRPRR